MSSLALRPALRLKLLWNAGGVMSWMLPLFLLAMLGLLALGRDRQSDAALLLALLGGMCNWFWWMFGGARLLGLLDTANKLALPRSRRDALVSIATAALITAGLPALLASSLHAGPATVALGCLAGAAGGLAYATLPPWVMFAVIPLPMLLVKAGPSFKQALSSGGGRDVVLLALILAAGLVAAWGWRRTTRREWSQANPWMRPTMVSMQAGTLGQVSLEQQAELQGGKAAWMQGIATPRIPRDLREQPADALAVALGPAFAPTPAWATLAAASLMPAALLLFWMLIGLKTDLRQAGTVPVMAWFMLVSGGSPLLTRMLALRRQPTTGMDALALLPGLGRPAERVPMLAHLITRRLLLRTVPFVLMAWVAGAWCAMPPGFYTATVFVAAAFVAALDWLILRSVLRAGGTVLMLGVVIVLMGLLGWSSVALRAPDAGPVLSAVWSGVTLVATVLYAITLQRLRRRPHPWLQN